MCRNYLYNRCFIPPQHSVACVRTNVCCARSRRAQTPRFYGTGHLRAVFGGNTAPPQKSGTKIQKTEPKSNYEFQLQIHGFWAEFEEFMLQILDFGADFEEFQFEIP